MTQTTPTMSDRDAALTVLSGTINMPQSLDRETARVRSMDFETEEHAVIWRSIERLYEAQDVINAASVIALCGKELSDKTKSTLKTACERWPGSVLLLEQASQQIVSQSQRRQLIRNYTKAIAKINEGEDIETVERETQHHNGDHLLRTAPVAMFAGQVAQQIEDKVTRPHKYIKTGIPKLDHVLGGGLDRQRLISISGQYKSGKTTLLTTIGYNAAYGAYQEVEEKVLSITLERDKTDVEMLNASRYLKINQRDLESRFSDYQDPFYAYAAMPERNRLRYFHKPGATLEEIVQLITAEKRVHGTTLVLIDYYQLVANPKKMNLVQHLMNVDQVLSRVAGKIGVAIVIAAQADADGLPRDCKTLLHSGAANFSLRRTPEAPEAWLENLASNYIEQRDAGSPSNPSLRLNFDVGPHFEGV